jgi:hypothetical protein
VFGDTSQCLAIDRLPILSASGSSRKFFDGPTGRPNFILSPLRFAKASLVRTLMKSRSNSATSYWLSDSFKAALKRDPIDAAHDAEQPSYVLTQLAQEQTANALT